MYQIINTLVITPYTSTVNHKEEEHKEKRAKIRYFFTTSPLWRYNLRAKENATDFSD